MNVLVVTNLFPNKQEPTRGMFVFQETIALAKRHNVFVIAPLPWTPNLNFTESWKTYNQVPDYEEIKSLPVYHPRYFVSPKVGRRFYGYTFKWGIQRIFKNVVKNEKIDLVISHYAYPDGFGTYLLTQELKLPHIIKVRGSEINVFTSNKKRKDLTVKALKNSDKVIAVSNALRDKVIEFGIDPNHVITIHNGIDKTKFYRMSKSKSRKQLDMDDKQTILFVGMLRTVKGVQFLLKAFHKLIQETGRDIQLIIVGDGELKDWSVNYVNRNQIADNVRFEGMKPHELIPVYLNACDILCLPSLNEGCPNIIIEAIAIGSKIVATNVGGIPELLSEYENCEMIDPGDADILYSKLLKQLNSEYASVTSSYTRSWEIVADEMNAIVEDVFENCQTNFKSVKVM